MDEFSQAVFDAIYSARRQRLLRFLFGFLLLLKHALRGFVFSWPLYLLSAASLVLPGKYAWAFLLLLIPAFALSGYILTKGLREDYRAVVRGRLLKLEEMKWALFGEGR